ncbi:MAG: biotin--[acetyl-CoA-carboxylase] ligase [Bacteroidia bacterium]|nr:biotin--[acetyl-CoA-carboxylase] ligase [Bacteroidia bacterium]
MKSMYLRETRSTNLVLKEMLREYELPEGFVLRTDFQSAGKGQPGNSWESEKGKNLLFSVLLYPQHIAIDQQFILSQLVSVAILRTLNSFCAGFSIKWPNDIYFGDKKIGGILIENSLQGSKLNTSIVGIGLNINQKTFRSDAPNPVSLRQITAKNQRRKNILQDVLNNIYELYSKMDVDTIRNEYSENLYRRVGFYTYRDNKGLFEAELAGIESDGCLKLKTRTGEIRAYYFKEVAFVQNV